MGYEIVTSVEMCRLLVPVIANDLPVYVQFISKILDRVNKLY